MEYGDWEAAEGLDDPITKRVIGWAISVHRKLGPGLLESAYQVCLAHELKKAGIRFERELPLAVLCDGVRLDCGYRLDFLVEDSVVLEIKCVDAVLDVHLAQLLTYLKLSGKQRGLILNFNVVLLKDGIYRRVLTAEGSSRSTRLSNTILHSASSATLR